MDKPEYHVVSLSGGKDSSVKELEVRFQFEDESQDASKPIKNRDFYAELKKRLEVEE